MGRQDARGQAYMGARPAVLASVALLVAALLPGVAVPALAGIDPNSILDGLSDAAAAREARITVIGSRKRVTDPQGDQAGTKDPLADLLELEIFELPVVPDYVLMDGGPFACGSSVFCSSRGAAEPEAFDDGAWLATLRLDEDLGALQGGIRYEWGALWALDDYPTTAVEPGNLVGGYSHLNVARAEDAMRGMFAYGVGTGDFEEFRTWARAWQTGDTIGILISKTEDLPRPPLAFGGYAFASDGTQAGTGRDVIGSIGDAPTPIDGAPQLLFEAGTAATPSAAVASAAPATAAPATGPPSTATIAPGPTGAPAAPTSDGDPVISILLVLFGIILLAIGWWLLRARKGGTSPPPDAGPTPPAPTPPAPTPPAPTPPAPTPPAPAPPDGPPGGPAQGPPPEGPVKPGGPVVGDPGSPAPPIPPPPPPPPRNCVEGEEEWRNDKPPARFLIPNADSRVRITSEPTTPELERWMAPFGFPHGATAASFGAVDEQALDALLANLPAGPTTYHWLFEFELAEHRLECERKWRCENDLWVPTGETRLQQGGPTPDAGRIAVDGPARTRDDVRRAWLQVRDAMVGASAAEAAMDAYRKAC